MNVGSTSLMRAAKNGDTAAIRLLLAHGADVNAKQKNGTTPLMFAAGLGYGTGTFATDYATPAELLESVKVLVAAGADVNAVSDAGDTPLHFSAQASDDIVKFLVDERRESGCEGQEGTNSGGDGVGYRAARPCRRPSDRTRRNRQSAAAVDGGPAEVRRARK